jgi:ankyrin repeat protein
VRQALIGAALLLTAGAALAQTPLLDAARAGDRDAALSSLGAARDIDAIDATGTTALMFAIHHGDRELVGTLLRKGARVDVRNEFGATPLSEAAVLGDVEILKLLLDAGADPDAANAHGQTPLMVIARTANVAAAKQLLKKGAAVDAREATRGQTALMWAAAQSQPAMVRLLVREGADVGAQTTINTNQRQISGEPRAQHRPSGGFTALMFAARQGCLPCVQALVEGGAQIDRADPDGVTPLIYATNNFAFDTAAWLLEKGANPNLWDWWGRTALYCAVDLSTTPRGGRADLPSLDQTTPLQLIGKLLEAGANPNLQLRLLMPYRAVGPDRGADTLLTIGSTPLLRAGKAADVAAVKLLLEHGADPALAQTGGITPLMAAAGVGSTAIDTRGSIKSQAQIIETIRLLLGAGADIDAADRLGRVALLGAAFWGYDDVIRALVDAGARLDVRDAQGRGPVDYALGRAGGQGRGGQGVVVNEGTGRLLEELIASRRTTASTAGR